MISDLTTQKIAILSLLQMMTAAVICQIEICILFVCSVTQVGVLS